MKNYKWLLSILVIIILLNLNIVYSTGNMDMGLVVTPISVSDMYGGESKSIIAKVSNDNWFCYIDCDWSTSQGKSGSLPRINADNYHQFSFDVVAPSSGSSPKQVLLTVECTAPTPITCSFSGSKSQNINLYFRYCGDDNCDTSEGESCSNCVSDCGCSSGSECRGGVCEELCGNGNKDSGETCSSCPSDVQCGSYERCQSGQCVAYCGNGRCDNNEDCSTCTSDCGCTGSTRCQSGQCVTFCGNGVCESSERTSCKADCDWCGDGTCQNNEECSTCEVDCGKCAPSCGDNKCDSSESCSTCSKDCGKCAPYCGDDNCDVTESCKSCSQDCGVCPKEETAVKETTKSTQPSVNDVNQKKEDKVLDDSPVTQKGSYDISLKVALIFFGSLVMLITIILLLYFVFKRKPKHKESKSEISKEQQIKKHCRKCGATMDPNDLFCEKCGKKLK